MATKIHEDGSVTIRLDADQAEGLAEVLSEWQSWEGWTRREDCQNWKRSPIARENRRESITFGNCLSQMLAYLGRREWVAMMTRVQTLAVKENDSMK